MTFGIGQRVERMVAGVKVAGLVLAVRGHRIEVPWQSVPLPRRSWVLDRRIRLFRQAA
jgi:hypothetical protein